MNSLKLIVLISLIPVLLIFTGCTSKPSDQMILSEWERGFTVAPSSYQDMKTYLWFYEWHMFEAVRPGMHTGGPFDWQNYRKSINENGTEAVMERDYIRLEMKSVSDGVDLMLTITNKSTHDWPEIAAIIPCFNPGPPPNVYPEYSEMQRNEQFVDIDSTHSYYIGQDGIALLDNRASHFNHLLRPQVEEVRRDSVGLVFDFKWPSSPADAHEGFMVRESLDGNWVAGIGWENSLSSQGHNPWFCMHLSVLVGPLKSGEKMEVKGKIYLFQGTKEECYARYRNDFRN